MILNTISLPALMQAAKPGSTPPLPWPNGSILPGRLEGITGGSATLIIASQRFLATLPPGLLASLPQGQLWLELLSREAPAHFRILSRQQAINEIAGRLAELAGNRHTELPNQGQRQGHGSWSWQDNHPLHAQESDNGRRLILDERESRQPRGMIERQNDSNGFALHGRVDLDQLGTLYFALQQQQGSPAQLKLRATGHTSFVQLHQPFAAWVKDQQLNQSGTTLQAELSEGDEPILKPNMSPDRHG
ncbi:MAG: hypothetical protein COW18_01610 [Zetaproteobacteria bacterium CG12_big_fil_rev_8_21_14_0_65_54_13]|nr:MAG: hypothetical protein COX55_08375 [Zetaproteobacteria bacterium CG23_combo_of_CG06-09_8_20_14_all_54_7]PIW51283.1 MAG: hypothetical protein COW18_01610 [Zetaproteobacteria bacterium CG12_big_fil_rev_8_21_14_0_65_54_13]PIX53296.1 MAG: hypothetical protein COZ50_13840 [Zetaproteobacteria bacterium CG_4_10_14_3_um_filter_54_28]PJA29592.1 MAG: hypothetical protein CO188_06230 [Zetaproteobacteria bacterium CG_4_9_14_3_um_filter_54_145]